MTPGGEDNMKEACFMVKKQSTIRNKSKHLEIEVEIVDPVRTQSGVVQLQDMNKLSESKWSEEDDFQRSID